MNTNGSNGKSKFYSLIRVIRSYSCPFVDSYLPKAMLICVAFFSLVPLFGHDVEIQVNDAELGLALEGAVIRSWDGTQVTCNEEGKAVISVPDDRRVVIQANYPGYEGGRLLIAPDTDKYTLGLRLSGIIENKE
jgi:hypothetical protein